MIIDKDEFINNSKFCIVTGKDSFGIQHIGLNPFTSETNNKPLCGRNIKHFQIFDLFTNSLLCYDCIKLYRLLIKSNKDQ